MYSMSFLIAAIAYVLLTVFIFFNYPESWRKNRLFICALMLWRAIGLTAVVLIFTVFKQITHEGLRNEIARIGTRYYIMTTLEAVLFFIRHVSSRTYLFITGRTGISVSPEKKRWITDKRVHAILIMAISYMVFVIGYFNADVLHETEYDVTISANASEEELTICLISDTHIGSGTWEYTFDDLEELINRADSDVLLIAGDVFDETTSEIDIQHFARMLESINTPRYGIYYVYGNHDNSIDDWAARQMRAMGVTVLEDELALIGEDIQLIGCRDPRQNAMPLDQLFEKCAPDQSKPILVLRHRPTQFRELSDFGADLAMAGHTHGFNIPQFAGSTLLDDMYSGICQFGGLTAITTSGVSAWGFHYKWPAISEVVTIHLRFAL